MSSEKKSDGHLSTENVAKLLMLSSERVRQLTKDGYIPRVGRNKYELISSVQGYIRYLKDAERQSSKSAAQSRMTDIKVARLEMQMKAEQHKLVPFDDVAMVIASAAGFMRTTIMSIPARFTRNVADRKKLDDLLAEAMNQIADEMGATADRLEAGEVIE